MKNFIKTILETVFSNGKASTGKKYNKAIKKAKKNRNK